MDENIVHATISKCYRYEIDTIKYSSHLLSGAEGLSSLTSIGTSSWFFTMRAERTVITFLALPSIVMEKTTLTGGRAEN